MSIGLITLVLMTPLEQTTKLIMVSLADCANEDGVCWPSIDLLAIRASTSRRNVFRILAALEQSGHVSRRRRGRSGSTVFQIHVDSVAAIAQKVTPRAPFIKEKGDAQSTFLTKKVTPRALKGDAQSTRTIKNQESKDSPPLFAAAPSASHPDPITAVPSKAHARRNSGSKKKADLSEHAWLTRWWCWSFAELTGATYAYNRKAAGIISGLLSEIGFDQTIERACAYLLLPERQRFPKGAPTLEGLRSMFNQLAGKFDDDLEAAAIRAGIFPGDDIPFLAYWTPWEAASSCSSPASGARQGVV